MAHHAALDVSDKETAIRVLTPAAVDPAGVGPAR